MNQSNENENGKIVVQANILIERQNNSCATTLEPREMYISSTGDKIINAKYIYKRQQSKKEIKWIAIAGKTTREHAMVGVSFICQQNRQPRTLSSDILQCMQQNRNIYK